MPDLQRIDELASPPVIGQRYLVPCVRIAGPVGSRKPLRRGVGSDGCEGMLPGWWPVLGPEHEDAALFDFPHQHWHFDLRFLSKSHAITVKTMDRIADAFELQSWQVLAELDGAVLR